VAGVEEGGLRSNIPILRSHPNRFVVLLQRHENVTGYVSTFVGHYMGTTTAEH
jgi:hypothetical protein